MKRQLTKEQFETVVRAVVTDVRLRRQVERATGGTLLRMKPQELVDAYLSSASDQQVDELLTSGTVNVVDRRSSKKTGDLRTALRRDTTGVARVCEPVDLRDFDRAPEDTS